MKGVLLKDLYIAKSGIIITLTSLFVLTFGLSFFQDCACLFSKHNTDSVSNIAKTQH